MAKGSSAVPTPSGTRDVLPDEMAQLRAITRRMVDLLDSAGYGEVRTPSVEYERAMPGSELGPEPAYRLADEDGDALVLRSDMTLPIARIATTRYAEADGPLRFCYLARSWRRVKPLSGEHRELLQVGGELIGADPNAGIAEILDIVAGLLEAAGLDDWRIAIGHSSAAEHLLAATDLDESDRGRIVDALETGDIASVKALASGLGEPLPGIGMGDALALRFEPGNGGAVSLEALEQGPEALAELCSVIGTLPVRVRDRLIVDLSLRPRLAYYEGIVFEVYDPAVGRPLGGGGRYDRLYREMGHPTTAVGFALDTELLHAAAAGERRGEGLGA